MGFPADPLVIKTVFSPTNVPFAPEMKNPKLDEEVPAVQLLWMTLLFPDPVFNLMHALVEAPMATRVLYLNKFLEASFPVSGLGSEVIIALPGDEVVVDVTQNTATKKWEASTIEITKAVLERPKAEGVATSETVTTTKKTTSY